MKPALDIILWGFLESPRQAIGEILSFLAVVVSGFALYVLIGG